MEGDRGCEVPMSDNPEIPSSSDTSRAATHNGIGYRSIRGFSNRKLTLDLVRETQAVHGRYVTFQLAEVAVPRDLFRKILRLIDDLRPRPAPA